MADKRAADIQLRLADAPPALACIIGRMPNGRVKY